jgi:hypothetical protein
VLFARVRAIAELTALVYNVIVPLRTRSPNMKVQFCRLLIIATLFAVSLLTACESPQTNEAEATDPSATAPAEDQAEARIEEQQAETATPAEDWVATRVDESQKRLQSTRAGEIVWESINTHGGLTQWFGNGPMHFRFNYQPLGDGTTRDTFQTIDTWSARARHQMADDRDTEFGWDGEKAWVKPADAELSVNARFWALTPYYFIGMPFVLADPGVNLELIGDKKLARGEGEKAESKTYKVVKATFGEGVGDAPDDYYVLYFDQNQSELRALRYVVSYPGFFPDGGHSPEKIMFFDGEQTAEGITLAERLPTHKWDAEAERPLEKVTDIEVSELAFRPDTPADYFEVPEGAKVLEGY